MSIMKLACWFFLIGDLYMVVGTLLLMRGVSIMKLACWFFLIGDLYMVVGTLFLMRGVK